MAALGLAFPSEIVQAVEAKKQAKNQFVGLKPTHVMCA
jgi:hypothetical protein